MNGNFYEKIMAPGGSSRNAVYGCIYMDQGESLEYAETQITQCVQKQTFPPDKLVIGFDLICTKNQIQNAIGIAEGLFRFVLAKYPNIYAHAIGITIWEKHRPARDLMMNPQALADFIQNKNPESKYFVLYEDLSEFESQRTYKISEGDPKKVLIYARELKNIPERNCPLDYAIKFRDLIETCQNKKIVNVLTLDELGTNYDEILESLSVVARANVRLESLPSKVEFSDGYKSKFHNLFRLLENQEAKTVVVSFPEVLGDDYSEIIASLSLLSLRDFGLHVAAPDSESI